MGNCAQTKELIKSLRSNDIESFKQRYDKIMVEEDYIIGNGHWTFLHLVCISNYNVSDNPEFVRWMVQERGMNVNILSTKKETPLHYAVCGLPNCTNVLLKLGANVHAENRNAETPIYYNLTNYIYKHQYVSRKYVNEHDERVSLKNITWLLLDHGARIDCDVPLYLQSMQQGRERARKTAIIILGIKRFRKSTIFNSRDEVGLIARFTWENRVHYEKWQHRDERLHLSIGILAIIATIVFSLYLLL